MTKRRSIISYDKLTPAQKRDLSKAFPYGYENQLTTIKTPTGEMLDALIWETEEMIYLVKINKTVKMPSLDDDDDDDDFDDDISDEIEVEDEADED